MCFGRRHAIADVTAGRGVRIVSAPASINVPSEPDKNAIGLGEEHNDSDPPTARILERRRLHVISTGLFRPAALL